MDSNGKIAIIGSGLIGQGWAMVFASAGYQCKIYDTKREQIDIALMNIKAQLKDLESRGLLRGKITAEEQFGLISGSYTLHECIEDAIYCQECVYEDPDIKRKVFSQIDSFIKSKEMIIASSTSVLLPSKIFSSFKCQDQMIVVHPINPLYFIPLVEIVPSPWTKKDIISKTREIQIDIGQKPILVKNEVPGFIVNRIQYAILNEAYRLIENDIISVEDVDAVMSEGLGMRYAFIGPWETAHLNAEGIEEYFQKYAKGIYNVSQDFGAVPKMEGKGAEVIIKSMNEKIPLSQLKNRRIWRDKRLAALSQLKKMTVDMN